MYYPKPTKGIMVVLTILFSLVFSIPKIFAQNTTDKYYFLTDNTSSLGLDRYGNAINMSTGTTQLVGASVDDNGSTLQNIGFTFPFIGTNQTQFSATSNGQIRLGATSTNTNYKIPNSTQSLIAPYVGDLATASNGKVHYKLFTGGDVDVLVIEFLNMKINYSSSSATGTFQARLYQNGIIEFVYGNMSVGGTTNTKTINIGFSNSATTNRVFSVNQTNYSTSTAATAIANNNSSIGTITSLNSTSEGNRRSFTFIPNAFVSQFVSISYGSSSWCAGEPRDVTVVVKNIGNEKWSDDGRDINIGLKWNVDNDYGGAPSYITRQDAAGLAPGATGTYVFPNVVPPAGASTENLTADVVYEAISWFGNNNSFVGPGNTVMTSSAITINAAPSAVTVAGAGAGCGSKTITASGGTGGTIYFQGTTSGGTSITTPSTSQVITTSGTYYFRSRSAAGCWGPEGSAVVTINSQPAITTNPVAQTKCTGSSVSFSVTATGSNLSYQWRKNGSNISGATAATYTISSVAAADAGNYDVVVSSAGCTNVTSAVAALTVNSAPQITVNPLSQAVCSGSSVSFSVTAIGTPTPTYQWKKGGVDIAGATSATYTINPVSSADAANYSVTVTNSCGTANSAVATLTVNQQAAIVTQPSSATQCAGTSVTFTVTATGTNLNYQWRKNGSNISGATTASYTINNIASADAADYDVVVSNTGCSNVTSSVANLTVNTAPSISVNPQSQTVCVGSPVTFTVTATGTPAPTYQWKKGGVDIAGANSSGYTINSATTADAGSYTVVVTNICSSATSSAATLTVNTPPAFTLQPVAQTICAGGSFTLSATATGSGVTYQWRKGGVNIAGATSASYTVSNAALSNAGSYDVVASVTSCSSATSTAVSVTVNSRPTAVITSSSTTSCSLQPNVISGNVTAQGAWTLQLSDGQQTSGTGNSTFSFTVHPATTTTYTITSLSDSKCTSISADLTGSETVNINPLPTGVSVTPSNQAICNGGSIALAGSGQINQTINLFTNNFNSGSVFTAAGTSSGNRSQIFTSEVSGSNVNSNGTFASNNGGNMMVAMSSATATFGQSTSSVSSTLTSQAINVNSGSNLVLTFEHTYNKANVSGSATVEISTDGTNWNTLTSFSSNVGNATSFSSESVNIPSAYEGGNVYLRFVYEASGRSSFFGSHTYWWAIDNVAINGNAVPLFSWTATTGSSINGLPANAGTPSVLNKNISVNPSQSTVYTLHATNPITGCEQTATSAITVNSRPTGNISGTYVYCRGANTTSVLTLNVTGTGTISGTLSDGTSFSGSAPQITVNVQPVNTTIYTIATLNDNNCSAIAADISGSANVTVNERPTAILSGGASYCVGDNYTTQLTLNVTGSGTISGQLSNGTTFSGTAPVINVNVTPSATETYTVSSLIDENCTAISADLSGSATIVINPLIPVSVSISSSDADNTICDGTSVTFTATPVNGGNAQYQWFVNGIAAGTNSSTFTTTTLENGDNVTVQLTSDVTPCAVNNPALSNSITTTVNALQPVSVSIISSAVDNTICDGTSVTFTASPVNEGANPVYQWMINGSPVGTNSTTFTTSTLANNDVVSVQLTSDITPCATGNPAISNSIQITVNELQPVSIIITPSAQTACSGSAVTFTSEIINGGDSPAYQWMINGIPVQDSVSATITLSTLQDGDIVTCVLTSNITPCATNNPATSNAVTMSIGVVPPVPGAITGPLNVCEYTDQNIPITYSIEPVEGATSYTWTVPIGATLISGQGTTSISVVIDNSFAYTHSRFKVVSNNNFPCSSAPSILEVLKIVPDMPSVISGPTNVCDVTGTATPVTYTIPLVEGANYYNWVVSSGMNIISGQGTTQIQVTINSGFVRGSVKVNASSNCGSRSAKSMNISADRPQAPGLISGPVNACQYIGQAGGATYSVEAIQNATSYQWTAPAGCTILSGQGTRTILLGFQQGYQTGLLKVRAVSNCYTSGERSLKIVNATYNAPGPIAGQANVCAYIGTTDYVTYKIKKVENAPGYMWTLPEGCTRMNGVEADPSNDTLVVLSFSSNFVSGSLLSVKAVGCITTSESTLAIVKDKICGLPSLISGPTNVCEYLLSSTNNGSSYATYSIKRTANATSYVWTVPAGATIVSHPNGVGISDTVITVIYDATFEGGEITVAATNSCGTSPARSLGLNVLKPRAPGAITVTELSNCPSRIIKYSLASMPGGATSIYWTVPAGGTIISGQGTISIEVAYANTAIAGNVSATPVNNCSQAATRSIKITLNECAPGFTGRSTIIPAEEVVVNVYPNPSRDEFKVNIKNAGKVKIRITDHLGREVKVLEFKNDQVISFGRDLKPGSYFVEILSDKTRKVMKVIKM